MMLHLCGDEHHLEYINKFHRVYLFLSYVFFPFPCLGFGWHIDLKHVDGAQ